MSRITVGLKKDVVDIHNMEKQRLNQLMFEKLTLKRDDGVFNRKEFVKDMMNYYNTSLASVEESSNRTLLFHVLR